MCSSNFVEGLSPDSCVTRELTFVYCKRAIFLALQEIHLRVLHKCKKHVSNTSCAACKPVFLCDAHKLTAIIYQRRIKAYNEISY